MSLLIQHGYGKSDKIERAISEGKVRGVILSPKDETPESLKDYIRALDRITPKVSVLFDPQFYASTISPVKEGNL